MLFDHGMKYYKTKRSWCWIVNNARTAFVQTHFQSRPSHVVEYFLKHLCFTAYAWQEFKKTDVLWLQPSSRWQRIAVNKQVYIPTLTGSDSIHYHTLCNWWSKETWRKTTHSRYEDKLNEHGITITRMQHHKINAIS